MSPAPVLAEGHHVLALRCPTCKELHEVGIYLSAQLIVDGDGGRLKAKLGTKADEHACGQRNLGDLIEPDPELFDPTVVDADDPDADDLDDDGVDRVEFIRGPGR
jgi:hypothetical protein